MVGAGDIIFGNLALLFAIGVAIGLTADAGVAALAGTVGFLVFNKAVSVFMEIKNVNVITCAPQGADAVVPDTCPPADAVVTTALQVHVGHPELERPAVGGLRQHPGHPDPADRCVRRHHHRRPGGLVLQQVVPDRAAPVPRILRRQAVRARSPPPPSPCSWAWSAASRGRRSARRSTPSPMRSRVWARSACSSSAWSSARSSRSACTTSGTARSGSSSVSTPTRPARSSPATSACGSPSSPTTPRSSTTRVTRPAATWPASSRS